MASYVSATYRQLWLLSGNQCAYNFGGKNCKTPLIDADEQLKSEIAHIVAESDGGPRAIKNWSKSERNHPSNLMIMCFDHHKRIDRDENLSDYTVERLREMKRNHEAKYAAGIDQMSDLLERTTGIPADLTAQLSGEPPSSVSRIIDAHGQTEDFQNDLQVREFYDHYLAATQEFQKILSRLPLQVRHTLGLIVKYGTVSEEAWSSTIEISWHELCGHVGHDSFNTSSLAEDVRILNEKGVSSGIDLDGDEVLRVSLRDPRVIIDGKTGTIRWDTDLGHWRDPDRHAAENFWVDLLNIIDGDDELLRQFIHAANFSGLRTPQDGEASTPPSAG
ncbi:HNH endonuclease signature motif containing protein [Prescottella equi]|uniref:HNH endonuclease signature motif containing protein n=1 Tax=Rhodococcus hoagii TaxID=43767 RepID=UPI003B7E0A3F